MSEPVRSSSTSRARPRTSRSQPTRALESRLGRAFTWLPFAAPGIGRPKPASPDEDRGARHRRVRTEYLAHDLRRYAESRGLDLGDLYREPDTTAAALGLLWLRRRAPALAGDYVTRVFDHLWRDNVDAADLAFVETVTRRRGSGLPRIHCARGPARARRRSRRASSARRLERARVPLARRGVHRAAAPADGRVARDRRAGRAADLTLLGYESSKPARSPRARQSSSWRMNAGEPPPYQPSRALRSAGRPSLL